MKNVVILYGGAKNKGGIYTYILNLFEGLAGSNQLSLRLYSIRDWTLVSAVGDQGFTTRVFGRLAGILPARKSLCDVETIVTMGMVSNFYGRLWGLLFHIPVITVIHSDWRTDYSGSVLKRVIYLLSDRLLRAATTRYICVSEYLRDILVSEGISPDKIVVVYNGVLAPKRSGHQATSVKSGPIKIATVGRLHPVKNYKALLTALSSSEYDIVLDIIGEGSERGSLERQIKSLGLENRVRLVGQVEDIYAALSEAQFYIQPSLSEGFGLAVVEAMLIGLPVLVTPVGSLPEIAANGEYGLVMSGVEPAQLVEGIEYSIKNKSVLDALAKRGQAEAKRKFDIGHWLEQMTEILAQ